MNSRSVLLWVLITIGLIAAKLEAGCASGNHRNSQAVGYDAIYVAHSLSGALKNAFDSARNQWNASHCNPRTVRGAHAFPFFSPTPVPGARTVHLVFRSGLNPRNSNACGVLMGNKILVYERAIVEVDGLPVTLRCDRVDVFEDMILHEFGHLLGLRDQYAANCQGFAMAQTTLTCSHPASCYRDRNLMRAECSEAGQALQTPAEQMEARCAGLNPPAGCEQPRDQDVISPTRGHG